MPLIKSKSKKAFSENVSKEMHAGKPQPQALAIAYSVKRKAKKASGGAVESGSRDMNMAEGGEISAKSEKRPMPESEYNDRPSVSHNEAKKQLIDSGWTDSPTIKQAQSNNGRMVKPIKQPKMVPSDAFSVRMRDEEADLQSSASPGKYDQQPPSHDNEDGPDRQGPEVSDMAPQHNNGKPPYNKAIEDQYAADMAEANMKRSNSYARGGPVMQPKDHAIELREREDEADLQDMEAPSEDEGMSEAYKDNEEGPDRQGPNNVDKSKPHSLDSEMYHDDMANEDHEEEENPAKLAEGGHIGESQDNYADDGHEDSIVAAIMSKRSREQARAESGARDLDEAVRMARGGEILEDSPDIHSHGSMDSDDSDQADLSRNADEDANEEDQASFDALRKENYSESEGLAELDQPMDSGMDSDDEEMNSHDRNDRVSAIRSRMSKRQFKQR